jgi:hypothetical protein
MTSRDLVLFVLGVLSAACMALAVVVMLSMRYAAGAVGCTQRFL